jgi:cytochrome o ubiquinol oxidase operon protein cyoD
MQTHHQTHTIAGHGNFATYLTGYVLAILLTLVAFGTVAFKLFPSGDTTAVITLAAICQAVVHMWFFLHMFRKSTPFWNTISFAFTVLVIILLIGGSLLILLSANYNMMPQSMPSQIPS